MICKLSHLLTVAVHSYHREQNERKVCLFKNECTEGFIKIMNRREMCKTMEVSPGNASLTMFYFG